jgi:hypothetical protein
MWDFKRSMLSEIEKKHKEKISKLEKNRKREFGSTPRIWQKENRI